MAKLTDEEYIAGLVAKARAAQKTFEQNFTTQRAVDEVVRAIAVTIYKAREELAPIAVEETGMGTVAYKITKMVATCSGQWNSMRGQKSMGFIDNPNAGEPGVRVIAKPIGVIGVVCPTTNPIITIVCNGMQAIKCRNACIIAPHPKAKNVSLLTVNMIRAAFKEIGAPEDLIQIIEPEYSSIESTTALLQACDTNIGTGGPGMVRAVNSCGHPGFGVGQGNTQEIICEDWEDYAKTCPAIVANRAWDLGVPCTGDQMVHVPEDKEELFLEEMQKGGAFLVSDPEQVKTLREYIFPGGGPINRAVVGKAPQIVGKAIGIDVPEDKKIFLVKVEGCGKDDDLCRECLFPISRYRTYKTFEEAVDAACANLYVEGAGHNSSIWTNDPEKVDYAALRIPVCRFHVNQVPLGSSFNGLPPTTTLGCGFWGNNSISENFTWRKLFQTTRVTTVIPNKRQFRESDFDEFDVCPFYEE